MTDARLRPEDMAPDELTAFVRKALTDAKKRPVDKGLTMWWESVTSTKGLDRIRLK